MSKKKKIIIGISVSFLSLSVIAAGALYYLLTKSFPQTDGSLRITGLSAAVEIYRDEIGVPHIVAQNEYDLYFAAGFVTAQDRLWQMDLMRRYGEGRLSEIFGSATIPVDQLSRTIGFTHIADSLWKQCSQQTKNILEAYANGVNACIDHLDGRHPIEFDLLQYRPEAWSPQHSLIIGRLMGWELAISWWVDETLYELVQRLGEEKAAQIFPFDDPLMTTILRAKQTAASMEDFRSRVEYARNFFQKDGSAVGSNSWTVTKSKSMTRLPLLANDTHLEHIQPAKFYIMHLSAPGINAAGLTLPGAPGIIIGHNDQIAWGMTNVMADDVDFYIEHINPEDSTYNFKNHRIRLRSKLDTIFVKDSLPVPFDVRSTLHGPLISNVFFYPSKEGIAAQKFVDAISMRWVGFDPSDEVLAMYRINHAKSWESFTEGLRTFAVPGQNFVYADRAGNIGYLCGAKIPIRPAIAAMLPSNGWDGRSDWQGYVPFDKMPRELNPKEDFIATANNKTIEHFPYYITGLWESDSRVRRIIEMLKDQTIFTYNDFRLMQMDLLSPYARGIVPYFVEALRHDSTRDASFDQVRKLFEGWDCRMYASSIQSSIYNVAFQHLLVETFADEMNAKLFDRYLFLSNVPTRVLPSLLADTTTTWFDNVTTPQVESRDEILRHSIRKALVELEQQLGSDMKQWSWGKIHQVTFRHPMGAVKPLDKIFNIGPYELGGNTTTVNNSEFSYRNPYEARVGPAMRMIINLASLDTCSIIIPTGQSGQPLSRHYSDQTVFWQNGAYHVLLTNIETIKQMRWDKLTLEP